eukprot:TRINITY_DN3742_c0_g1_i3.p1 TRINITY_DN3742_c0_g1~~TRINITY_DN3742_c0_g1_i3.p1  ORF type:complete len:148 (+),score=38.20 TRINITY_DN3742_c0_g1_i3:49-492(+)
MSTLSFVDSNKAKDVARRRMEASTLLSAQSEVRNTQQHGSNADWTKPLPQYMFAPHMESGEVKKELDTLDQQPELFLKSLGDAGKSLSDEKSIKSIMYSMVIGQKSKKRRSNDSKITQIQRLKRSGIMPLKKRKKMKSFHVDPKTVE